MEKTEMMKRYEAETGKSARGELYSSSIKLCMPTNDYIEWLEAKAAAYDRLMTVDYVRWLEAKAAAYGRLMSGGKKTLKEWANIFGMYFCVDADGDGLACENEPYIKEGCDFWYPDAFGESITIPSKLIDYTGDWTYSLTLPDGWEDK